MKPQLWPGERGGGRSAEQLGTKWPNDNDGSFEHMGKVMREKYFNFDPSYLPLNHGSYGAFPTPVKEYQRRLQDRIEARSDPIIRFEIPKLLLESRALAAGYLGAPLEDVVLVPNATTAINTVLRNLTWQKGDVIVYFSFAYPACVKTVQQICESTPAQLHCIDITFPMEEDDIVNACITAFNDIRNQGKTPKVHMFDTVVTFPGVRLPWERLVDCCRQAGVLSLIDGAHGIGHIDLKALHRVGPDFFTSNCYKWLYTPRACAIFYVPRRNHSLLRTSLPTSHGFQPLSHGSDTLANSTVVDQHSTYFTELFKWVATVDQTPYLCVPAAVTFRSEICGGDDHIRRYCFRLAHEGGDLVASKLGTEVMRNSTSSLNQCCFTNIRLPLTFADSQATSSETPNRALDAKDGVSIVKWIMEHCMTDYDTWIPGKFYNGAAWVRLSAQIYLDLDDFKKAADILLDLCLRVQRGQWSMHRDYVE